MSYTVFINYRRDDVGVTTATTIAKYLQQECPAEKVFVDRAAIPGGAHWETSIKTALKEADTVVVVIGPEWLTLTQTTPDGRMIRRIDNPNDWVRTEIVMALAAGKRVIPTLLDAKLPDASDLPADLVPLLANQAVHLSQDYLHYDLMRLAGRFENSMGAGLALILGLIAFVWQLSGIVGVQTMSKTMLLGMIPAYPSQVILYSLCGLGFVLLPLHWLVHRHLRSKPTTWFPAMGQWAGRDQLPFRIAAFLLLLVGPTVIQCFWVGRTLADDHMKMVGKGREYDPETDSVKKTREIHGLALLGLSQLPESTLALPAPSSWAWSYWYDVRAIKKERGIIRELGVEAENDIKCAVAETAIPLLMPWWFLVQGGLFVVSTLSLFGRIISGYWRARSVS